jgi:UDP-N-acetylglucosamine 1-carboxyvinyltransferase
VAYNELGIIPDSFRRMGIQVLQKNDDIYIPVHKGYTIETFIDGSIMTIADAPWPGLTPDLLSVFLVIAAKANGSVLIHHKLFESRLFFVDKLIDMGRLFFVKPLGQQYRIGRINVHLRASVMSSPDILSRIAYLLLRFRRWYKYHSQYRSQ